MSILRGKARRLMYAALALLLASPGFSEEEHLLHLPPVSPVRVARSFAEPVRVIRELSEHGLQMQFLYVHDLSKAPGCACDGHRWFGRSSWDLAATADGEKLGAWKGSTAFLHIKHHLEEFGAMDPGVFQGYSNIDADSQMMLYELWAQQSFFSRKLHVKAGKIDANTDFDAVPTAADFLNSSMGYSPTIMEFPSYPAPKFGVDAFVELPYSSHLILGRFATDQGTIALAEGAHSWKSRRNANEGRAAIGLWRLHEPLVRFDGSPVSHARGFYGVLEQSLWRPSPMTPSDADAPNENVSAYVQVGNGDKRENPNTWHLGAGVVWTAPCKKRTADAAGWAVSSVGFSDVSGAGFDRQHESVFEMYYKFSLTRAAAIVMDTQYFRHPGGMRARPGVLFFTPRLVVSF